MDQVRGDLLALFIEEVQRLAQGKGDSICFHPLHPPRLGFARQRKLLTQLTNLACRAGCTPIHLGYPGSYLDRDKGNEHWLGTVNLMGCGRNDARNEAGDTDGYAVAATPVTAAQI
jgi:hypothetical protein